jgi:hypothetical protein
MNFFEPQTNETANQPTPQRIGRPVTNFTNNLDNNSNYPMPPEMKSVSTTTMPQKREGPRAPKAPLKTAPNTNDEAIIGMRMRGFGLVYLE